MAIKEVKIPSPGESITEVEITQWLVEDGDQVEKDQEIAEIESDKATLPLIAEDAGKISIQVQENETVQVGTVACTIDTAREGKVKKQEEDQPPKNKDQGKAPAKGPKENNKFTDKQENTTPEARKKNRAESKENVKITPVARKIMKTHKLSVDDVLKGLRKINKEDVEAVLGYKDKPGQEKTPAPEPGSREKERKKMSQLRKRLGQRLVSVKNETAMLTTFNEVDMSKVMKLRKKYQKAFMDKHGVKLGFMSFFTKAATIALSHFPNVNAMIDGDEVVHFQYQDIGIAVQTEKGLMVPVIRNAGDLDLASIEKSILELAGKARDFKLSIDEMSGGTFTITNGGIFGSMLSTPIINPPQAGILGLHNIVERPVAVQGKVEIRPIMYLALSYDHRLIDGKDSVQFLVAIKELIEGPSRMLFPGNDPEKELLGI